LAPPLLSRRASEEQILFNEAGELEVLLITTKQRKRWIVPKGRRIRGLKPAKCAAREAFEEAGVLGAIGKKPIGAFRFVETVDNSLSMLCRVRVYPMKVKRQMRSWPDAQHCLQRWFELAAALTAVNDAGLKAVSKYPPAKPGALRCEPLIAAIWSLTRPRFLWAA
jgi:8-oxo-dGTP pyrophosphatase MutT (NUDIX family)